MHFAEQKYNFDENKAELKIENTTHSFRDTNLALQLIQDSQIKSKTVMSWSLAKAKTFFVPVILSEEIFFKFVFYLNV